jgi:hypothetical protein
MTVAASVLENPTQSQGESQSQYEHRRDRNIDVHFHSEIEKTLHLAGGWVEVDDS